MKHILTIDLEEWYHGLDLPLGHQHRLESRIEPQTRTLLSLLAAHDTTATFFVVGEIARKHPALIETIAASGHEIASHGTHHIRYFQLTEDEIKRDIDDSLAPLQDLLGRPPLGFRAPCFSVNESNLWILGHLAALGFGYDSSLFPVKIDRYGIRDMPMIPHHRRTNHGFILEYPVTPSNFFGSRIPFAGGAYFRILPWVVIRRLMAKATRVPNPVVFYAHPWELDPAQPHLPGLPFRLQVTRTWGLQSFARKFETLLSRYRFGTIAEHLLSSSRPLC